MIERVEELRAKLDCLRLPYRKLAVQRQVEDIIPRARQNVPAGVAESVRRGCTEGIRIEEVVGGPLAAREPHADSGYHVRPVRRARVGGIKGEVDRVERRSV